MKQKNWKMVEVTLVLKQLFGDLDFEDDFSSEDITCAIEKDAGFYGPFSRIYQPVEELWLLESSDLNISDDLIVDATDSNSMSQYIHSPENKGNWPRFDRENRIRSSGGKRQSNRLQSRLRDYSGHGEVETRDFSEAWQRTEVGDGEIEEL